MKRSAKIVISMLSVIIGILVLVCAVHFYVSDKVVNVVKERGETLVVGFEHYKPYLWVENGIPRGCDYDLVHEVARRNGWEVKIKEIYWHDGDYLLRKGDIDCLWNGVKVMRSQREKYGCTAPYMNSGEVLVMHKDSAVAKIEQLEGYRIAIQKGTPIYELFTKGEYYSVGKKNEVIGISDFPEMKKNFESGETDGIITDYYVAKSYFSDSSKYVFMPEVLYATHNVVMFQKEKTFLRDQVQETLQKMSEDGTLQKLIERWIPVQDLPEIRAPRLETKKLLVLFSENSYHRRSKELFEGFLEYLMEHEHTVACDRVNMNITNYNSPDIDTAILESIDNKLRNNRYDLIVTSNNFATNLFLEKRVQWNRSTPIVTLSNYGDIRDRILSDMNITGMMTLSILPDNMTMALQLIPLPDQIVVICESSPFEKTQHRMILDVIPQFLTKRMTYITGENYTTEELLDICSKLTSKSIVVVSSWNSLKGREFLDATRLIPELRQVTPALILGTYAEFLPLGIDGGVMTMNHEQGRQAGGLAERILMGESVSNIPMVTPWRHTELKYAAVKRLGLNPHAMSPSITITNLPKSWLYQWRNELYAGGVFMLLVLILLLFMIWSQRKNHRQTHALLEERNIAFRAIADGVLVIDCDGYIKLVNSAAEKLTGYTQDAAMGRRVEEIFKLVDTKSGIPIASPITDVLHTYNRQYLQNHRSLVSHYGKKYPVAYSVAPIHGVDGVRLGSVLIFRDVTDEYHHREKTEDLLLRMEYGSRLTHSASFLMDLETWSIDGTQNLATLVPIENGVLLPLDAWVCAKDVVWMEQRFKALQAGVSDEETLTFQSNWRGHQRFYRWFIKKRHSEETQSRYLFSGAIQDITEITQSMYQLKENQALWELMINSLPIMFFVKDADNDFRYLVCNQEFADYMGRSRHEIIGKNNFELLSSEYEAKHFHQRDLNVMQKGKGVTYSEVLMMTNGEFRETQCVKQPFVTPNGKHLLLGAIHDVSDLRQLLAIEKINSEMLMQAVSCASFDTMLDRVAEVLMQQMKYDRLFVTHCPEPKKLRLFREWCGENVNSIYESDINLHYQVWDENLEAFKQQKILKIVNVHKSPITAKLIKNIHYNTKSLMVVPIYMKQEFWGALFVAYATHEHHFSDVEENMVRSCANVISLCMERDAQNKELEAANKKREMILDNIQLPIWLYDAQGRVEYVNRSVLGLMRCDVSNLQNRTCGEIFDCPFATPDRCPILRVIEDHRTHHDIHLYNGKEYLVEANPILNADGKLLNIVKSSVDVTDLHALLRTQLATTFCLEILLTENSIEEGLKHMLETFSKQVHAHRSLISHFEEEKHLEEVISEYAGLGRKLRFNGGMNYYSEATAMHEARFQENALIEFANFSLKKPSLKGPLKDYAEEYKVNSMYAHRIRVNGTLWGSVVWFYEEHTHSLTSSERKFVKDFIHCVEIIIERKMAQTRLMDALEKAKSADRAKSYFLASMSHEIRTPLNAVIGFSELLKDDTLPPAVQKEYLSTISSAGNALSDLINDILDLSKLEANQMVFTPVETDFVSVVREIGTIFKQRLQEKGLMLRIEAEGLPRIYIDRLRIRQVLFNLIGNAIKFTKTGTITVKVAFQNLDDATGTLTCSVADTGCGIPLSDQMKIFEMFVQSHQGEGKDSTAHGTGLGLAICRRLVEAMDGDIALESECGKGSIFTVTLHHVLYTLAPMTALKDPPAVWDGACLKDVQILVIDDVPMNLKVIAAMLQKYQAYVVTARSVSEAREILKRTPIDVMLVDLWIGDDNGVVFVNELRAHSQFQHVKYIAVTADTECTQTFDMHAFDACLIKPITLDKLCGTLVHLITSYREISS